MVISKTFSNEPAQKRKRPIITLLLSISLILLIKTYIFGKRPFLNSPTLDDSESKRETIRLNDQLNSAINTSLVQESKKKKYYVLNEWLQLSDAYERALTWSLNKRFQLNPAYKDKTFKICFFATFYQYKNEDDRSYYNWIDGARKLQNLDISVWGPGFAGWDSSLSTTENFVEFFGCDGLDMIIAHPFSKSNKMTADEDPLPDTCGKTVILYEYGDCDAGKCMSEYIAKAHIMSFRNAFVPLELFDVQNPLFDSIKSAATPEYSKVFAHNPDCADSEIFKPISWKKKNTDVVTIVGDGSEELFQLRSSVLKGISSGVIKSQTYNYPPITKNPPKKFNFPGVASSDNIYNPSDSINHLKHKQLMKYSAKLSSSKICILDSTVTRKTQTVFFEAIMAGCVIASDLPFEMEEIFSDIIIVLDSSKPAYDINKTIRAALDDEKELRRKAAKGMVLARKHFTCEHKTERALFLLNEHNAAFRGYYLPFGVRLGCHSYLPPYDNVNPWCQKE